MNKLEAEVEKLKVEKQMEQKVKEDIPHRLKITLQDDSVYYTKYLSASYYVTIQNYNYDRFTSKKQVCSNFWSSKQLCESLINNNFQNV